jgi:allantoinase
VFAADEIEDRATNFKCAPPIREKRHQEGLWQALKDGRIDMVTSDHSPCPPGMKNSNFLTSWGGIAGVQMLLPAVWTGAQQRDFTLTDLARWLCQAPARLAGLDSVGSLEVGRQANLVAFDPDQDFLCESLFHRHPGSPYEGRTWRGVVEATHLRGERVFHEGEFSAPRGRLL